MPFLCQQILNEGQSTCEPSVGEKSDGESNSRDEEGINCKLTMQSLELHQSLSGESIVEELVNEIMVLPVGELDVGRVAPEDRDCISVFIDHARVLININISNMLAKAQGLVLSRIYSQQIYHLPAFTFGTAATLVVTAGLEATAGLVATGLVTTAGFTSTGLTSVWAVFAFLSLFSALFLSAKRS